MRAAMANLPFATMMSWEMHSCRLLVAIRQAQKTDMTSPALTVPLRTSDAPNQKPWTNIAMLENWLSALVKPQTALTFVVLACILLSTSERAETSYAWALNALTVAIALTARSTSVAETAVC